jgi:hypothetical protein
MLRIIVRNFFFPYSFQKIDGFEERFWLGGCNRLFLIDFSSYILGGLKT